MNSKEFVLFYAKEWEKKYGARLSISWQKNLGQAKRLLASYSEEALKAYAEYYIHRHADNFADRVGRHLGAFVAALPAVVAAVETEKKKSTVTEHPDYQALEEARKRGGLE